MQRLDTCAMQQQQCARQARPQRCFYKPRPMAPADVPSRDVSAAQAPTERCRPSQTGRSRQLAAGLLLSLMVHAFPSSPEAWVGGANGCRRC